MSLRMEAFQTPADDGRHFKLWDGDRPFADLYKTQGHLVLEIHPREDHNAWHVPAEDLEHLLQEASHETH